MINAIKGTVGAAVILLGMATMPAQANMYLQDGIIIDEGQDLEWSPLTERFGLSIEEALSDERWSDGWRLATVSEVSTMMSYFTSRPTTENPSTYEVAKPGEKYEDFISLFGAGGTTPNLVGVAGTLMYKTLSGMMRTKSITSDMYLVYNNWHLEWEEGIDTSHSGGSSFLVRGDAVVPHWNDVPEVVEPEVESELNEATNVSAPLVGGAGLLAFGLASMRRKSK